MAVEITLTDLSISIPLVYDVMTNTNYKVMTGGTIDPTAPTPIWHSPHGDVPELTNLEENNRIATFRLLVDGSDMDALQDNLATLRRWIDGKNQQASNPKRPPIYLKVKRNGSTNSTLNRVIYGVLDDGNAQFATVSQLNDIAFNVTIQLTLAAYGEAETAIQLDNYVENPDFSITGGNLAAGWTIVNAEPAANFDWDTDTYLINGGSQKATMSTSGRGFYSASLNTAPHSYDKVDGYVWIYLVSGEITVRLYDTTGASTLASLTVDTTTITTGNYNFATDKDGNVWYQLPVNHTFAGTSEVVQLSVISSVGSGAATWYSTMAYAEFDGDDFVGRSWQSSRFIYNRGDADVSNPERLPHVDIWGVGGDASPALKLDIDPQSSSTGNPKIIRVSNTYDGNALAANQKNWIEAGDLTTTNGAGSWSTGTGTTANNYSRYTHATGTYGSTYAGLSYFSGNNSVLDFFAYPRRLLVLARSSSTSTTLTGYCSTNAGNVWTGEAVAITATGTWELLDLGVCNLDGLLSPSASSVNFGLTIDGTPNTGTVDIDAFAVMWQREGGYLAVPTADDTATNNMIIEGRTIYVNDSRGYYEDRSGGINDLIPGDYINRIMFLDCEDDNEFDFTRSFYASVQITPRTRQLLGTL